jgi:hypothetical protein
MIRQLHNFAQAYPTAVFSEPTAEERKWLHKTKPGLQDRIAASMARHVANCLLAALEGPEEPDDDPA